MAQRQVQRQPGHLHEREERTARVSKKSRIIALYISGMRELAEIASYVGVRSSYVAQVLQREGLIQGYFDLYTSTAREPNLYARQFRNVLAFKNPEVAR